MTENVSQDRAFHYGDGLFTTMLIKQGKVNLWRFHYARLVNDSERLGLHLDMQRISERVAQAAHNAQNGVLKLHISAGVGGRGYARPETPDIRLQFSVHDIPAHYQQWQQQGIHTEVSPVRLGLQPLLAGIKHLNRLEQVLIKQQLTKDDAIVCDIHNHLIEGSASNLFLMCDGVWVTPCLDQCGVAGVYRSFLLETLADMGERVVMGHFDVAALEHASAVFLCNTLMGIVPVKIIDHNGIRMEYSVEQVWNMQNRVAAAYERENEATY